MRFGGVSALVFTPVDSSLNMITQDVKIRLQMSGFIQLKGAPTLFEKKKNYLCFFRSATRSAQKN